jgi:hypothetical protein
MQPHYGGDKGKGNGCNFIDVSAHEMLLELLSAGLHR